MHLQLLLSKVYLYLRDAFKSPGCCHIEMALLTLDCEVQMYEKRLLELEIQRKVAGSVVAAENIRSLKCFLKHFLKRHQDQLLSLPFFLSLSLDFSSRCLSPPSLKLHLTYRASAQISLPDLLRDQQINNNSVVRLIRLVLLDPLINMPTGVVFYLYVWL